MYRSGRITASRMKAVCHTDPGKPSQSLIRQICYPQSFAFSSRQTKWGCSHEVDARKLYEKKMKEFHKGFDVSDSGFIINPKWPFVGATPDGNVACTCCGRGVLEIKCPYCHKGESIEVATANKKFCLNEGPNGEIFLDQSHAYFYQVQTQLFVGNVDYCDFCVCTFAQNAEHGLHIERITKDVKFWSNCIEKAEYFFKNCLLPELVGKWYTHLKRSYATSFDVPGASSCSNDSSNEVYCYCKGQEEGQMIACDIQDCIQWFHFECLKMKQAPKGKWFCPDCRKLSQFIKKQKKMKTSC